MPKWKQNNWTLSTGGIVKNKEDFIKLDAISKKLEDLRLASDLFRFVSLIYLNYR